MYKQEFEYKVNQWAEWIQKEPTSRYDFALFKIWIQFENYLEKIFKDYCLGIKSTEGYEPKRQIIFVSEQQLLALLREMGKEYLDYQEIIKNKSSYIFDSNENPFDLVYSDRAFNDALSKIKAIRNYVAHESGKSLDKYTNACLGTGPFVEPDEYLKQFKKKSKTTNYSFLTEKLKEIIILLENPIFS